MRTLLVSICSVSAATSFFLAATIFSYAFMEASSSDLATAKAFDMSSPSFLRMPTISPLAGAYSLLSPPWRKARMSLRSKSSSSCLDVIRLFKYCAALVCKKAPDIPPLIAATASSRALMLALCSAASVAYSAAAFSRSFVASAMLALAAVRSVCCAFKSSLVWANFAVFSSISEDFSGTSASYAAVDFSRSALPVLHWHMNFSCISSSFSPSAFTLVCMAVNMLTTLRIGLAPLSMISCISEACAAGAPAKSRNSTRMPLMASFARIARRWLEESMLSELQRP
mmetsp:Transcript_28248/g.50112  ORF Transcript_28248/g.50112 Transcript_28248/m.50112 type:complete len:284 (+) Transcript_28248:963-1814(+)